MAKFWTTKPPVGILPDYTHPTMRGCVGLWLLNEGAGGGAYDLSGFDNDAALNYMSGTPSSGWAHNDMGDPTMAFDGTNDELNAGAGDGFNFSVTNKVTWEGWIKYTGTNVDGGHGLFGAYAYHRIIMYPGAFYASYWNTAPSEQVCSEAYTFVIGEWYHLAIVLDDNIVTK